MTTFYTATLGCKINQYETRSIGEAWAGQHVREVGDAGEADLILVNSCAVTANAVADLRQTVRRFHRDNPKAEIIITGCAAQVMPDELAALPGVVRVVAQEDKAQLLDGPGGQVGAKGGKAGFAPFSISGYDRARAVVKVQDGCSHFCTYCIVPLTRGRSVSRPVNEVVDEVGRLLAAGFREFILSGINLRHFGRDLDGKPDFWDLVARLEAVFGLEWTGRARFRISSVEPGQLDDKALDVLSGSSMVCPQLHLSLQSGDSDVLKAMGRGHYSPQSAVDFMERLAKVWPVMGLGADLITGFPGETEARFENTLELCRALPLTYGHVFPYSERPGTRAVDLPDPVEVPVRKERAARLRKLVNAKKSAFLKNLLTLPHLDVLVQDAQGRGVSQFYAACRIITAIGNAPRSLVRTRPVCIEKGVVLVEPLEDAS
ncbi:MULTISPECIES: MiaB/RimO family radical SAM methylthiotransferase [unclassified Pseudodesulfovibrio]|uniref:MiaB/RimO family radical SAM methylthiotransferase n=1 Tax=unclassified Pseudodesulfovibrio TaxID=2661612 RepID=UPI000FEBB147|nr:MULTISPECIES: MiaB/RimO family radical SAM methylthiotransferase [unclassified Pseudodesulfovibrio]MCJ2162986.1 MiaB/RimO family radical SAM methylthiotransferase [Pseudodesulfovibrio sp. S3-i]RWU06983.1 MiaB/RimO family radical SAM methylthiotransferase [Pseudodesulfovibrio sp. S3]